MDTCLIKWELKGTIVLSPLRATYRLPNKYFFMNGFILNTFDTNTQKAMTNSATRIPSDESMMKL